MRASLRLQHDKNLFDITGRSLVNVVRDHRACSNCCLGWRWRPCRLALPGYEPLATQVFVMILFALSLDLLVGYAGIVTLGHAGLFGMGGLYGRHSFRARHHRSDCHRAVRE